jgi:hypothetical protein
MMVDANCNDEQQYDTRVTISIEKVVTSRQHNPGEITKTSAIGGMGRRFSRLDLIGPHESQSSWLWSSEIVGRRDISGRGELAGGRPQGE